MSSLGKLTSTKNEANAAMDAAYAVYLRLKAALAGYPRTSAANPRFQNDFNGLEAGFLPLYDKVKQNRVESWEPWIYFDDKAVSYTGYFTTYLTDFTNAALALGEISTGGGGGGGGGDGGGGGGGSGDEKSSTMLYVGLGIAALVAIYLYTKPRTGGAVAGLSRRRDRRGRFV